MALALAAATNLVSKVGVGRAITLGMKSIFTPLNTVSVRKHEIELVRQYLNNTRTNDQYVVVIGGKGLGKSCLVNTKLDEIVYNVLGGSQINLDKLEAKRDMYWIILTMCSEK